MVAYISKYWISFLPFTIILLATSACFSDAAKEVSGAMAEASYKFQPLREIDNGIIDVANQYSDRLKEFNQTAQAFNQTARGGLRTKVSADVGDKLNNLIHEFNQKIDDINHIKVGVDDNTLAQLDGLMMLIERGVKIGLDLPTLETLDGFRIEMANQPERWQGALSKTISALEISSSNVAKEVAEQLSLVSERATNDITRILDEATLDVKEVIATTGVEGRCNAEFLESKLESKVKAFVGKGILYWARVSLLGEVIPNTSLTISGVCHFIPSELSLAQNNGVLLSQKATISVYGYGFSQNNRPAVKVVNSNQQPLEEISNIGVLVTTRYQLTINLQGVDFSKVGYQDQLWLVWPNLLEPNELAFVFPSTPTPTLLPPTLTPTETPIPEPSVIISSTQQPVNVRLGPSTDYADVGDVYNGEQYKVTGKSEDGTWWRIDYNGVSVYVFGGLVTTQNLEFVPFVPAPAFTATPIPAATATNTPAPTDIPTPTPTPVTPPTCPWPSIPALRASPESIGIGQSSTISWDSVANVDGLSIYDGFEYKDVSFLLSTHVQPQATTTYSLIAHFCGESRIIAEVVVSVDPTDTVSVPRKARIIVLFTQIHVIDDSEPENKEEGEISLELDVNGQRIYWPEGSRYRNLDDNEAAPMNSRFEVTLTENDSLSIYVNGMESDDDSNGDDPMGAIRVQYDSRTTWGQGEHTERSNNYPDRSGVYNISYTISVTWE